MVTPAATADEKKRQAEDEDVVEEEGNVIEQGDDAVPLAVRERFREVVALVHNGEFAEALSRCLNEKDEKVVSALTMLRDERGSTLLHLSVRSPGENALALARFILSRSTSAAETRDALGSTPLHVAVLCENVPAVALLVREYSASISTTNRYGDAPTDYCRGVYASVVRSLLLHDDESENWKDEYERIKENPPKLRPGKRIAAISASDASTQENVMARENTEYLQRGTDVHVSINGGDAKRRHFSLSDDRELLVWEPTDAAEALTEDDVCLSSSLATVAKGAPPGESPKDAPAPTKRGRANSFYRMASLLRKGDDSSVLWFSDVFERTIALYCADRSMRDRMYTALDWLATDTQRRMKEREEEAELQKSTLARLVGTG